MVLSSVITVRQLSVKDVDAEEDDPPLGHQFLIHIPFLRQLANVAASMYDPIWRPLLWSVLHLVPNIETSCCGH